MENIKRQRHATLAFLKIDIRHQDPPSRALPDHGRGGERKGGGGERERVRGGGGGKLRLDYGGLGLIW